MKDHIGRGVAINSVVDRLYSALRTSQIEKTPEEKEAISELASSLGIASGFVKDAHAYLSEYTAVCDDLLALHPQILSLLPVKLVMEINRLNAVTQAWRDHAESECFTDRTVDFGGAPEPVADHEMDDILKLVGERKPEPANKDQENRHFEGNVVSLF